jgi:hypothetical protein
MNETSDEDTGMAPEPPTDPFLAPRLNAEHLTLLRRYGQERPTTAGQVLFREGDRGYDSVSVKKVSHEPGLYAGARTAAAQVIRHPCQASTAGP